MEIAHTTPFRVVVGAAVAASLVAGMSLAAASPASAAAKGTVKSVSVAGIKDSKPTLIKGCTGKIRVKLSTKGIAKSKVKLVYSSSDSKVATVSRSGVIRGKKTGKVTITIKAKAGNTKTAKVKVTVVDPKLVTDAGYSGEKIDGSGAITTKFAAESISAVLASSSENACYSPLSAYMALGMVGVGANDTEGAQTQQQILNALGADGAEQLGDNCDILMRALSMKAATGIDSYEDSFGNGVGFASSISNAFGRGNQSTLTISNSIWCKKDSFKFGEAFESTVKSKFRGESQAINFLTEGEKISDWISNNTNGLLRPTFSFDDETVAALVNTVYFKDGWTDPFSEYATKKGKFTTANGGEMDVKYMQQTIKQHVVMTDTYTSASLRLGSGAAMTFYLPKEGIAPQELMTTSESVSSMLTAASSTTASTEDDQVYRVSWKLPKFSFESTYNLNSVLGAMGITDAFDEKVEGDFAGMLEPLEGNINGDPYVSEVQQGTRIGIDEVGVEAAAYTAVFMAGATSVPDQPKIFEFNLDRPFAYTITANDGTLLFAGTVQEPSKA